MLNDISQTKVMNKSESQYKANQYHDTINPIVKHTYDELPKIYGTNNNRKRKYNISLSRQRIPTMSNYGQNMNNHQKNFHSPPSEINQNQRNRGYSCIQFTDKINNIKILPQSTKHQYQYSKQFLNERSQVMKTALIQAKQLHKDIDKFVDDIEKQSLVEKKQQPIEPKSNSHFTPMNIVDSISLLSKPKQRCNKKYCSCKSLYDEYQQQVNKKLRANKLRKHFSQNCKSSIRSSSTGLKLPKLQAKRYDTEGVEENERLQDKETKHKVFRDMGDFKNRVNNFPSRDQYEQRQQKQLNRCNCHKNEKSGFGLLGLVKKQMGLRDSRTNMHQQSFKQQYIQQNKLQKDRTQGGIQVGLGNLQKKMVDQQINTQIQQIKEKDFKYLQNRQFRQSSQQSSRIQDKKKKQPLEHLSRIKERYSEKMKKPRYKNSKYEDQLLNSGKQQLDISGQSKIEDKGVDNSKKKDPSQQEHRHQELNTSIQSILSDNSLAKHLANALGGSQTEKKTFFSRLMKKFESQHSSNQQIEAKKLKIPLMNQSNLFTIPQEDEYLDYLKSYEPISKDFKIKDLAKSQNFRILRSGNSLYFGQVDQTSKGCIKNGKALFISPKQIFEGCYEKGIKMEGCERNIDGYYIGQYFNGKRHGKGRFKWNNGQIYQGMWQNGSKNGLGKWTSPKGDYYQGEWLNGRQTGHGIHKHKNSIYSGDFMGFLKHGFGIQKYINGDVYEGQYKEGKVQGKGKYLWKNGSKYQGQFKGGFMQGKGRWQQQDGVIYQGQFKRDFKHGHGTEYYRNGEVFTGQFIEGKKVDQNKMIRQDGETRRVTA